jgi:prefoldin subunit 5
VVLAAAAAVLVVVAIGLGVVAYLTYQDARDTRAATRPLATRVAQLDADVTAADSAIDRLTALFAAVRAQADATKAAVDATNQAASNYNQAESRRRWARTRPTLWAHSSRPPPRCAPRPIRRRPRWRHWGAPVADRGRTSSQGRASSQGKVSGWLVAAVLVAFAVALVAAGALVWARREADDADTHRAELTAELAASTGTKAADRLAAARATIDTVRSQLDAIPGELQQVTSLEQQDAALVQAALDAGKKGDVPAYNEAVTKRNVLAPQVDAAVEKLRTDVNAALTALATVTNRTVP